MENKQIKLEENKKSARKNSVIEGCFSGFSSGTGDNYITPFAKELLAHPIIIGMLSAFPGLISPLIQTYGSSLMEKHSRKSIVLKSVFFHALLWVPLASIALLAYFDLLKNFLPYLLIIGYSLLAVAGGIAAPAWFSWMGDIVSENERGRYFSKRNRITGSLSMLGFLFAAFLLDILKAKGMVFIGFAILFFLASLSRFIAMSFFSKQFEPELKIKKEEYYFTFWQFLKRYSNFVKFSVFMAALHVATMTAGPFFAVYMLKELNFSYITFMAVSLSGTLFSLILAPLAGRFSDKYGNLKLVQISSALLIVYPLLWAAFSNPIYLIFITQVVGGIASAAFAIGTSNFIYDTVTPARRAICVSYMNILVGVGVFSGSLLGGLLLHLAPRAINPFIFVFIISSLLRFLAAIIFLPSVKELRAFQKIPNLLPIDIATQPMKLFQLPVVLVKNVYRIFKKETKN